MAAEAVRKSRSRGCSKDNKAVGSSKNSEPAERRHQQDLMKASFSRKSVAGLIVLPCY